LALEKCNGYIVLVARSFLKSVEIFLQNSDLLEVNEEKSEPHLQKCLCITLTFLVVKNSYSFLSFTGLAKMNSYEYIVLFEKFNGYIVSHV
jgi:hypothetical protein